MVIFFGGIFIMVNNLKKKILMAATVSGALASVTIAGNVTAYADSNDQSSDNVSVKASTDNAVTNAQAAVTTAKTNVEDAQTSLNQAKGLQSDAQQKVQQATDGVSNAQNQVATAQKALENSKAAQPTAPTNKPVTVNMEFVKPDGSRSLAQNFFANKATAELNGNQNANITIHMTNGTQYVKGLSYNGEALTQTSTGDWTFTAPLESEYQIDMNLNTPIGAMKQSAILKADVKGALQDQLAAQTQVANAAKDVADKEAALQTAQQNLKDQETALVNANAELKDADAKVANAQAQLDQAQQALVAANEKLKEAQSKVEIPANHSKDTPTDQGKTEVKNNDDGQATSDTNNVNDTKASTTDSAAKTESVVNKQENAATSDNQQQKTQTKPVMVVTKDVAANETAAQKNVAKVTPGNIEKVVVRQVNTNNNVKLPQTGNQHQVIALALGSAMLAFAGVILRKKFN